MYPVLFKIGNIPVQTYYVIWFAALALMLLWTVRRLGPYGIDEDEGRRVLGWIFLGAVGGTRLFVYLWDFSAYWNDPSLFLDLDRGGLSEVGGFCGAALTAFLLCRRNALFGRLCDAAAPPIFLAMSVGRWGCFFAGCCAGVRSAFRLAVRFPYDSAARHPTQLYYSFSAAAILAALLLLEFWGRKKRAAPEAAPGWASPFGLAPAGLFLYALMRFSIDTLREGAGSGGFGLSHGVLLAALPLSVLWFWAGRPGRRALRK
jgi:phosphatidylglycerol:prolipoprotein diacylglycerol transferase